MALSITGRATLTTRAKFTALQNIATWRLQLEIDRINIEAFEKAFTRDRIAQLRLNADALRLDAQELILKIRAERVRYREILRRQRAGDDSFFPY